MTYWLQKEERVHIFTDTLDNESYLDMLRYDDLEEEYREDGINCSYFILKGYKVSPNRWKSMGYKISLSVWEMLGLDDFK